MQRSYKKMMMRHVSRIIVLTPLALFATGFILFGLIFMFEDFLAGIWYVAIGTPGAYFLGKMVLQSITGIFTEKHKKVLYKDVHITQSRKLTFMTTNSFYAYYIATDTNDHNYIITPDFDKYIHENGFGLYRVGIQEDAELTDNFIKGDRMIKMIEAYSIEKMNDR